MNSANQPESSPPAAERIQFLLSRQLDGDLTQEESSELATSLETESHLAFRTAITDLHSHLRALPSKSVSATFATRVRNAILQEAVTMSADASQDRRHGWITRGIIAVSVTACAAALLVMLRPFNVEHSVEIAGVTHSSTAERVMADSANTRSEFVDADLAAVLSEVPAEPITVAQQDELRPFLENDDWRIVVVKIHSKDREEVMRDIESLVAKYDMNIRPIAGHDDSHDVRFGVLLTSSTGVDDKVFIDSVVPQDDAKFTDWNAQSIAESTRESLISRLQESMKTPTHSELYFGQVYVTLPKPVESRIGSDQPLRAKNSAAADSALPAALAEDVPELPAPAPSVKTSELRTPVLVVFEFAETGIDHI